jgi:hypothetical protein
MNFAASLLYWERLLAQRQKQKQKRDRGQREEKKKGGGGGSQQSTGLSLRKLVVVEATQLGLSVILLGCQMSFDGFSNQYVYILPAWMLCSEVFVHFGGGRAMTE